jgi:proteasome lid subunit RPN8/RPN11
MKQDIKENKLKINKIFLDQMANNCIKGLPNEACGIVAAKNNNVVSIIAITNAESSPETYMFDSREHFKAMKLLDQNNWELIGFYHSHICSEAKPSKTDLKLAAYPDAYYFIVSLKDMKTPVIKAFQINNTGFKEHNFEVIEDD